MNLKKLVLFGLLFWVIVFVVWTIVMFIPGLTHAWQWIIAAIVDAVVVFLLAKWYFKSVPGNIGNGLLFGLGLLVVGNILDAVVTVPLFIKDGYGAFYGKWELWVCFAIVLVAAGVAGLCKGKCKKEEAVKPVETPPVETPKPEEERKV